MDTEQPERPAENTAAKIHPVIGFIQGEWRVIKTLSFWIAVALAGLAIHWFEENRYAGTVAQKDATIQAVSAQREEAQSQLENYRHTFGELGDFLKNKPASMLFQVMYYTNDPVTEKIFPSNPNAPALIYSLDGTKSTYSWDVRSRSWK